MTEFVSVLIPCRNEIRFLARCLDSVLQGTYPRDRMEVLVIDGGSQDGTRQLIESYRHRDERVRLIDNPERITPCALNRGIDAARGGIIARIDAHSEVAPDYLEKCVAHLLSSGADNVGGSMRTLPAGNGWFAPAIVTALSHRFGVGNSRFRTTVVDPMRVDLIRVDPIAADSTLGPPEKQAEPIWAEPIWVDTVFGGCWRREVFDRIGRFNSQLPRSQDMEFSRRLQAAGGRTLLVPEIRCDYFARTGVVEFCRHNFANGKWAILPFLYSEVTPVSARHLIPLCFVIALLAGCGVCFWSPWPLALVAGSYACANLLASTLTAFRQRSLAQLICLPLVFLALHVCYGCGSLAGVAQAARILWSRKVRPRGFSAGGENSLPRTNETISTAAANPTAAKTTTAG